MADYSNETREIVKNLRLIDDLWFRLASSRKEFCQEVLRTLLDDDELEVLSVTPQETITSTHREVTLDVLCRLKGGRLANIEVQKGSSNDDIRRCRFHLSAITANKTPKGTEFKDVPDVEVLYITEYDALGNNQTVTVATMCQLLDGDYIPLNDGAKIYYANTAVKDGTDKSELLELFTRRDVFESSKFPKTSEVVRYYKGEERGSEEMCEIVEKYAEKRAESAEARGKIEGKIEGAAQEKKNVVINMYRDGDTVEKIHRIVGLDLSEIERIIAEDMETVS